MIFLFLVCHLEVKEGADVLSLEVHMSEIVELTLDNHSCGCIPLILGGDYQAEASKVLHFSPPFFIVHMCYWCRFGLDNLCHIC